VYPLGLLDDARRRQLFETQIEVRGCHADMRCCRGTRPTVPLPSLTRKAANGLTSPLAQESLSISLRAPANGREATGAESWT
jgi:hypothetical protein